MVIQSFKEDNERFTRNDLTERNHSEEVQRSTLAQYPKSMGIVMRLWPQSMMLSWGVTPILEKIKPAVEKLEYIGGRNPKNQKFIHMVCESNLQNTIVETRNS